MREEKILDSYDMCESGFKLRFKLSKTVLNLRIAIIRLVMYLEYVIYHPLEKKIFAGPNCYYIVNVLVCNSVCPVMYLNKCSH